MKTVSNVFLHIKSKTNEDGSMEREIIIPTSSIVLIFAIISTLWFGKPIWLG